jgi:RHS repeat-associated protein
MHNPARISRRVATVQSDSETSLWFYRARYYDSQLQRFISEDPIGFAGGTNLYGYAYNNPIDFRDPFGLAGCDQSCQNQIGVVQNLFPGSTYDPATKTLTIPQSTDTVERTLVDQGYQEPGQWWNPFLYWDPIAHSGGDEFRIGVGDSSFHFRRKYAPGCPFGPLNPATCLLLRHQMVGRKTVLDEFHTDDHDPARDPKGHILHDVLHLPDYFDYLPYSPF